MTGPKSSKPLTLESAQLSDVGMRRANNQDAIASVITDDANVWQRRGHLLMVADGMGAHAAGELASKMAVDNVPHTYYKLHHLSAPAALRQAIREANEVINNKGRNSIDFQGMGTTCTTLVIVPQGALVAHVGDSRAYRLRGGNFQQLTFDHSLVWEMAAAGQMAEENVPAFVPKNVITRSLGPHPTVNIDLEGPYDVEPGDVFLICSDGLSGQVSDEEMGAIVANLTPEHAVQTLVDMANLRGGPDNISVIVARVEGTPAERSGPSDTASTACSFATPRPSVPIAVWAAMIGCVFLLGLSGWARWPLGVVLGAAGLGASVAIAVVERFGPNVAAAEPTMAAPYGNGPYRECQCAPGRAVVDAVAELAGQLRDLAGQEQWPVHLDWQPVEEHHHRATSAVDTSDLGSAVTEYCHAIRITMQQLREHRATVSTQSGINLS